ncbi:YncE family protein [Dactylosporangium vinaceum]|uniref:SMP-30/gluconolactonase/LRE family protein n=1 Tax=Dactylosporangium vinaceum TaxID=53362 RepID=A0ABV5MDS2_9ACTN|nr:YncE family protein [Dactylosporangium vinaceum]UAC01075.1 YncE family protein [Dactylosporangium vinaceum]
MTARLVTGRIVAVLVLVGSLVAACSAAKAQDEQPAGPGDDNAPANMTGMPGMSGGPAPSGSAATRPGDGLAGMPALLDPHDVYAADRPNALSDQVRNDPSRVYVPNLGSNTVSVIDPATFKVIKTVPVGGGPQHVVPAWDLRTLWVNDNTGNQLVPLDPATGTFGKPVKVDDPYNLYFTPDGKYAMVMSEARHKIVFRDPHTMAIVKELTVDCAGVNHADFSPDGRYFIATCEFSGDLIKVDVVQQKVIGQLHLPDDHAMPQDIKISPDGGTWYVADMHTSGVWIIDGDQFTVRRFLATGAGAHGLYVSRDSKHLYIANRGEGSVSLLDFATGALSAKWKIPGGGSPDMGGVSADGTVLWLSGRYNGEVYALSTTDGHLLARIKVGTQPHGLCVWPQPGRYSLGHTGILR